MIIDFRVIPHAQHRYETVGDYWEYGDTIHFRVSELSDPRYEWLVFLHELTEHRLCKFAGVLLSDIDAFDENYEQAREAGNAYAPCGCKIQAEPGFDSHAPYYWQHRLADIVERAAAFALGVDWVAYEHEVDSLCQEPAA